ncbi:PEP-CTERM sorting domain-containing protein [Massilia sp. W12]|uniref:PEP-CTERM sorting domain-containing protein n=1 Tax=Massilia sp. W12 TaxID=3126507 RepID=UPI0030D5EE63
MKTRTSRMMGLSSAVMFASLLAAPMAQAATHTFTFEEADPNNHLGTVYGTEDGRGWGALIRDGFMVDIQGSGPAASGDLHFHEVNSQVIHKVPDRPTAQRGVLWRDGMAGKDPLFFKPTTANTVFSLQSLVVGNSTWDGSQTTAVQASAWRNGRLLATVDLATPQNSYASYGGSGLGALQGLQMDRLEFIGLSSSNVSYYMLDDVVLQTSVVPEPETWGLLGMGLLALMGRKHYRKQEQKITA